MQNMINTATYLIKVNILQINLSNYSKIDMAVIKNNKIVPYYYTNNIQLHITTPLIYSWHGNNCSFLERLQHSPHQIVKNIDYCKYT